MLNNSSMLNNFLMSYVGMQGDPITCHLPLEIHSGMLGKSSMCSLFFGDTCWNAERFYCVPPASWCYRMECSAISLCISFPSVSHSGMQGNFSCIITSGAT